MGTVVVANLPTLIGRACKCDLLYVKVAVQPDYGLWMFVAACAFGSVCQMWICFCTDVAAHSVTLPGWPNPSPKRLYLCRSYRGEGDLEGEFLRRRRLSPCLARPGDLERDNDLDREDSARRPYLRPGDRDLPIFRCAPMNAAVKRRRAAVEGQCQLLSSEKTSAPPQSFWKICFWKSFWRIYGLHEKYRNPNRGSQAQSGQKAAARPVVVLQTLWPKA